MLEHEGGAKLGVLEMQHSEYAGMLYTLQNTEFACRHSSEPASLLLRGRARERIDTDTTSNVG